MKTTFSVRLFCLPCALVALGLFVSSCKPRPTAAPVVSRVRHMVVGSLSTVAEEPGASFLGVIRGDTETSLSFKVNGQLSSIGPASSGEDWRQGESVRAGDVIARLDPANFINAVAAARARAELARANYARTSELYAASNLSKSDYDAVRAQREMADADLSQAEQYLRDSILRAPYDGVVLARLARNGEFAAAGRPVLVLGDFRRVSLELGVPDSVLAQLRIGGRYEVLVSAHEGLRFSGEISELGIAADPASRLFRVVMKIDNADARLKSGMTASVRLGGRESRTLDGALVPLSALAATATQGGRPAVFVVGDDGLAHLREVATSEIIGSSILVRSGLRSGDKVVTLGVGQLSDGMAVLSTPVSQ